MSEYDRLGDLHRIQKREYERIIPQFAKKRSLIPSSPIYTDRSTMERKQLNTIPKRVKKR